MQQQQSSHTTLQYLQQLNAKSIIPWQPVSTEGMSGPKRILEVRALPHLQGLQRAEKHSHFPREFHGLRALSKQCHHTAVQRLQQLAREIRIP